MRTMELGQDKENDGTTNWNKNDKQNLKREQRNGNEIGEK